MTTVADELLHFKIVAIPFFSIYMNGALAYLYIKYAIVFFIGVSRFPCNESLSLIFTYRTIRSH